MNCSKHLATISALSSVLWHFFCTQFCTEVAPLCLHAYTLTHIYIYFNLVYSQSVTTFHAFLSYTVEFGTHSKNDESSTVFNVFSNHNSCSFKPDSFWVWFWQAYCYFYCSIIKMTVGSQNINKFLSEQNRQQAHIVKQSTDNGQQKKLFNLFVWNKWCAGRLHKGCIKQKQCQKKNEK